MTQKPYLDDQWPEEEDIMNSGLRLPFDFNTYDRSISGVSLDEFEDMQEFCYQQSDYSDLPDDFEQSHDDYDEDDYYAQVDAEVKAYEAENGWI
jgi:hypothetical protein